MDKSQLALLTDEEYMLVLETTDKAMSDLGEDQVADLHRLIRRARNQCSGKYRRRAAQRAGSRGKASKKYQRARDRAEVFEDALARVSHRLSVLAKENAAALRAERQAGAKAGASKAKDKAARSKKR
ncbi:MAG: hypothetical protein R2720_00560 [Candidatus Nanopelagicales bacterium]